MRQKPYKINIGVLIFGAILIYLIASLVMYFTSNPITSYEVKTGSLSRTSSFTGIILREETVVKSTKNGEVAYYQPEASKVRVGSNICVIGRSAAQAKSTEESVPAEVSYGSIVEPLVDFQEGFSPDNFEQAYSFHQQLNSLMLDAKNQELSAELSTGGTAGHQMEKAQKDGIISYHIDNMEQITVTDLTAQSFEQSDYELSDLRKNAEVTSGEPLYKIITSDFWSICILLDENTYEYLNEKHPSQVQIQVKKDNSLLWADLELKEQNDMHLAILSMDQGMIRYAGDRYLDITLNLQNETGLKIPQSAVTSKPFYLVPTRFLSKGGNSSLDGVLVQEKNAGAVFVQTEIYRLDEENEMVYIDMNVLKQGQVLLMPDSSETYTVGATDSLRGVYNINKGYAVFKQIDVLAENSEYCIAAEGTDYGIANYDFIALDSNSVKEDDIVH